MVSASATDKNSPDHDYFQYNLPWSDEQSLSTDMKKQTSFMIREIQHLSRSVKGLSLI